MDRYPDSDDAKDVTSVTWSGTTATATVAGHGFSTDDWVYICGAEEDTCNGWFQVTYIDADTFSYTVDSEPTGTIRVYDPTGDDRVWTGYDRLGRTTGSMDQRGVVHLYSYNSDAQLCNDTVASLGGSQIVDGSVQRIQTEYDDVGRVEKITSYDGTANVVNQVQYVYDGWGNVTREYQEHGGAVDSEEPGVSPHVDYLYDDGADQGVAKYVRLKEVTYPDGRIINYDYSHGTDAAVDEVMSRLSAIYDDADDDGDIDASEDVYASYRYLGADSIVRENYEEIQVDLDYRGTNNSFSRLDRFGRAAELIWNDYGASSVRDHYTYSYDRVGNLDTRDNELHAAFDLDYDYDGLYRLTDAERAADVDQSWDLDATGNWSSFDDDGTSQTREVDEANQIESITGGWITPEYDAAGNMISGPKPGDETTRIHYVYDAWNRLVEVRADNSGSPGTLIGEYTYDALNRRVEKAVTSGSVHTHYFYSGAWQCVEERVEASGVMPADANIQYVWGARYVDNLILRDRDADANAGNGLEERLYALQDAHFDVTALFDASTGAVVERFLYDAYGNVTELDPDDFTTYTGTDYDWEYTYTTRREDAETGLMYCRNRYYQAGLGRFISRDPIGNLTLESSLYAFCQNRPVSAVDPSGLTSQGFGSDYRGSDQIAQVVKPPSRRHDPAANNGSERVPPRNNRTTGRMINGVERLPPVSDWPPRPIVDLSTGRWPSVTAQRHYYYDLKFDVVDVVPQPNYGIFQGVYRTVDLITLRLELKSRINDSGLPRPVKERLLKEVDSNKITKELIKYVFGLLPQENGARHPNPPDPRALDHGDIQDPKPDQCP